MGFPGGPEDKEFAMQEICFRSLDWDYPVEKGMATHSSILAWKISRTGVSSPACLHSETTAGSQTGSNTLNNHPDFFQVT